jgi:two-component system nitrogen regulation sensor histidine kinase GlnL
MQQRRQNIRTMKELLFSTDKKLRVCSWEKEIAEFTGRPASRTIGNKYYENFPRILTNDKDAVAKAIETQRAVTLKKYSFPCIAGSFQADIKIKPRKSATASIDLVDVAIYPFSTCEMAKRLQQSQKLIDIGKIASTLAHGVRNPLNAIKGAVVYLSEKYSQEAPLVEFTRIMEDEISRLENFISKFLSSSVSDTEDKETDINSLLKKIEVFISLQIYTRNIRSLFEFGDIPPVVINAFHLEQAVLNVINNAIDAMGEGGQLKIGTSVEERDGKIYVVVSIADTGQGMANKRIGELSEDRGNNGKGFGLFITHEILKHYHGHLELDSKMNYGTTIKLFIPSRITT